MYRNLVFALLVALPALQLAAGQHPLTGARAHPAISAYANATTGQANAARIEACLLAVDNLIDNLEKGEDKAATSDFDSKMRANLNADMLGETWKGVGGKMGKLLGRGTPQNLLYRGHVIVVVPMHFGKGDIDAQIACDADGKIAGFSLRPGPATPAPAPASSG
ncbi:MAG TPA: DUF3887 domain-containing protein [Rhodanobacteraceae bacterium]|nr:DUF3887 domain-containing protein [Rhodanobacteraceae bacterium]